MARARRSGAIPDRARRDFKPFNPQTRQAPLPARGADPNAKTKKGATILQAAIDSNQPEIAALLRKHGAK